MPSVTVKLCNLHNILYAGDSVLGVELLFLNQSFSQGCFTHRCTFRLTSLQASWRQTEGNNPTLWWFPGSLWCTFDLRGHKSSCKCLQIDRFSLRLTHHPRCQAESWERKPSAKNMQKPSLRWLHALEDLGSELVVVWDGESHWRQKPPFTYHVYMHLEHSSNKEQGFHQVGTWLGWQGWCEAWKAMLRGSSRQEGCHKHNQGSCLPLSFLSFPASLAESFPGFVWAIEGDTPAVKTARMINATTWHPFPHCEAE